MGTADSAPCKEGVVGVPATPSHAAEPSGSLAPPGASHYDHIAVGLQQHRLTLAFRGRWVLGNLPATGWAPLPLQALHPPAGGRDPP